MTQTACLLALLGWSVVAVEAQLMVMRFEPHRKPTISTASSGRIASSGRGTDIKLGTLGDGNGVWGDTPTTEFIEVPAWMAGVDLVIPSSRVEAGAQLSWSCAKTIPHGGKCVCFIFQYHCDGCDYKDGKLDDVLDSRWEKISCAPKFRVNYDPMTKGAHHPMIAYTTLADAGEEVIVDLPHDTDFILMGGDNNKNLVDCSGLTVESECEHIDLRGQCEWDMGTCINRRCTSKWQGPVGPPSTPPTGPPGPVGAPGPGAYKPRTCVSRCVKLDLPDP